MDTVFNAFVISNHAAGVNWPSDISVWMFSGTDSRRKTFPNIDGSFVFYGVEDGLHSLDVVAAGLQFPTVRGDSLNTRLFLPRLHLLCSL